MLPKPAICHGATLPPDPEIPDLKMFIRARNAVWISKRTIGIRGFWGLPTPLTNVPFHELPEIVNHELWLKCLINRG